MIYNYDIEGDNGMIFKFNLFKTLPIYFLKSFGKENYCLKMLLILFCSFKNMKSKRYIDLFNSLGFNFLFYLKNKAQKLSNRHKICFIV